MKDVNSELNKLSLEQLKSLLDMVQEEGKKLNKLKSEYLLEIKKRFEVDISNYRKQKPFGAVSVSSGGYVFTETIPKKVKWDQDELEKLYNSSDDAKSYIDVSYKVQEKKYNTMTVSVKEDFDKAREESFGTETIKLVKEEVKE